VSFHQHLDALLVALGQAVDRIGCGHSTQGGGMPTHREAAQDVERLAFRAGRETGKARRDTLAETAAAALFAVFLIDTDAAEGLTLREDQPDPPEPPAPPDLDKVRDRIVRRWRSLRSTPRPGMDPTLGHACYEDPAPDWVWRLLDAILARRGAESPATVEKVMESLVQWCAEGDGPSRSAQVRSLIDLWVGPRVPMLVAFLALARLTKAGARVPASPITRAPCGCEVRVVIANPDIDPPAFTVEPAGAMCDKHDPKVPRPEPLVVGRQPPLSWPPRLPGAPGPVRPEPYVVVTPKKPAGEPPGEPPPRA